MTTLLLSFTVDQLRRRSWLRGVASVLDLRGRTLQQYYVHPDADTDSRAIADDWRVVGDDLWSVVRHGGPPAR